MNLQNFSKSGAIVFLYGVGFIFAAVIAYQIVSNISPPNALAVGIVNIIIGYVINSVGVQHGVSVTNDTVAKTAIAQYPLTPDGIAHPGQAAPPVEGGTH